MVTMTRLLKNPSGPYSTYFARRDMTIKNLKERQSALLEKYKDFKHVIYSDKDSYWFYFKMPSEKYNELLYDVVIKFEPTSEGNSTDLTLNNYTVQLFSNAPNFIFTYAYVYNKEGILINQLKEKINEKALTMPPDKRNPIKSIGFEKSVYFALLYIQQNKLHMKNILNSKTVKMNMKELLSSIKTSTAKMTEYNRVKTNEKLEKENSKKVAKRQSARYNKKVSPGKTKPKPKRLSENSSNTLKAKKTVSKKRNMTRNMSVRRKSSK